MRLRVVVYFLACVTEDGIQLKKKLGVGHSKRGMVYLTVEGSLAPATWLVRPFVQFDQTSRKESVCEHGERYGRGLYQIQSCWFYLRGGSCIDRAMCSYFQLCKPLTEGLMGILDFNSPGI